MTEKPNTPIQPSAEVPARERLLTAGASVFSAKGYGGASVREICVLAGTSSNMIHHYFGSKRGLYDEILSGFSERVFGVPIQIIDEPPKSLENLITRLEIFVEETLEALLKQPELFKLISREEIVFSIFDNYTTKFVSFLNEGKKAGWIRNELDTEMLTGLILDRLGNQILYASWISKTGGKTVMSDADFKKQWLRANLDVILNGMLSKSPPDNVSRLTKP